MNVFEIVDKTGRKICLTKKQWKHITEKHPDISGKEEEIKQVLEKPDLILSHRFDENAGNYYKYNKKERAYFFVSAKYLNGDGFVITSFYTRHIRR
jgi:lipopolysaccharide biosynthesis glycosyltransferase